VTRTVAFEKRAATENSLARALPVRPDSDLAAPALCDSVRQDCREVSGNSDSFAVRLHVGVTIAALLIVVRQSSNVVLLPDSVC